MPAEQVADAVVRLLMDESLAGRVMVCRHDQPPTLLPTLDWPEYLHELPVELAPHTNEPTSA